MLGVSDPYILIALTIMEDQHWFQLRYHHQLRGRGLLESWLRRLSEKGSNDWLIFHGPGVGEQQNMCRVGTMDTHSAPYIINSYITISFLAYLPCKHFLHWTKTEVLHGASLETLLPGSSQVILVQAHSDVFLSTANHFTLCPKEFNMGFHSNWICLLQEILLLVKLVRRAQSGGVRWKVVSLLAFVTQTESLHVCVSRSWTIRMSRQHRSDESWMDDSKWQTR